MNHGHGRLLSYVARFTPMVHNPRKMRIGPAVPYSLGRAVGSD